MNTTDVECMLHEAGVFRHAIHNTKRHMDAYLTILDEKILTEWWDGYNQLSTPAEWLLMADYWENQDLMTSKLLACFIQNKISNNH